MDLVYARAGTYSNRLIKAESSKKSMIKDAEDEVVKYQGDARGAKAHSC
jgi:hypothetical protein